MQLQGLFETAILLRDASARAMIALRTGAERAGVAQSSQNSQNGWMATLKRMARPVVVPAIMFTLESGPLARVVRNWNFPFRYARECALYWRDLLHYARMPNAEPIRLVDLQPVFFQRNKSVAVDPQYFHAHIWALKRITELRPARHVDVASSYAFVGMVSALTKVCYVEFNPPSLRTSGVEVMKGDMLHLPFPDGTVLSLSCLHAAEHAGLGRYGDALDPLGTRKAAAELTRVLAPGSQLLFAVPVGKPRLRFNGQRIHAAGQIAQYFTGLELQEFSGVDDNGMFRADIGLESLDDSFCALGCFRFCKPHELTLEESR